jgi:hypothetical protein
LFLYDWEMVMLTSNRRRFLANVGRGMFVASVGSSLACDLDLARASDIEGADRITFGGREALVDLLQSTAPDQMLAEVVRQIAKGTSLRELTAAAALANGRAFAGEDYVGFHTLMALRPALAMAEENSSAGAALPVLKVLYRNSSRIQEADADSHDALQPVVAASDAPDAATLREAVHRRDRAAAEQALVGTIATSPSAGFRDLLPVVEEGLEVHRTVLLARAWDMISLVGEENAATMLRQSLRYCVKNEESSATRFAELRQFLPRMMDRYQLTNRAWGDKAVDDAWVTNMVRVLWTSAPDQAAEAIAESLTEGISTARIFEAISLATNQLVLCDGGRIKEWAQPGKPVGSVHGDSIGVHASDSVYAWKTIATIADARQRNSAIILAAYQTASDRSQRDSEFQQWQPRPWPEHLEQISGNDPASVLGELKAAIESNDQSMACAATARYGELGGEPKPVFALLRDYATSQDGALHAEKYYYTVRENFRATSPAFRWRHLVALARVTASEYGRPAPGYEEAKGLLNA